MNHLNIDNQYFKISYCLLALLILACLIYIAWGATPHTKQSIESFLDEKLQTLETTVANNDPSLIRLWSASDSMIEAVAVWDKSESLLFPDQAASYLVTDHVFTKSYQRFENLRKHPDTRWERYDINVSALFYCVTNQYSICLQLNTAELAKSLSLTTDSLESILFGSKFKISTLLLVFLVLLAIYSIYFILQRRIIFKRSKDIARLPSHVFTMGDMQVDKQRLQITRGEYSCDITLRDLKLLSCFYEHVDQVLTKDKLYTAGWGRDFVPSSRSLEQHIVTLRKKLDPTRTRQPLIQTVHGIGYRYTIKDLAGN